VDLYNVLDSGHESLQALNPFGTLYISIAEKDYWQFDQAMVELPEVRHHVIAITDFHGRLERRQHPRRVGITRQDLFNGFHGAIRKKEYLAEKSRAASNAGSIMRPVSSSLSL
jgi:hypothetical protein